MTRRERPQQDYDGFEEAKSSIITYLAPINSSSNSRKGSLLTFKADKLPIFLEEQTKKLIQIMQEK